MSSTPEWYRERAEEARTIAEGMTGDNQVTMREVADQWEAMAAQAEMLARVIDKTRT